MTWVEYHRASEVAAAQATIAQNAGITSASLEWFRKAAELEQKALSDIPADKPRTRGVVAISASSLWLNSESYDEAESIALDVLRDNTLPDFAREQAREICQMIWIKRKFQEANVGFLPGMVTVSIKGKEIAYGGAPLDLIVEKVQAIQAIFFRTIEYKRGMPHRLRGAAPKEVQEACRPWLFQAPPGSYQFTVAVKTPSQKDFFREEIRPNEIAEEFLRVLSASISEDASALDEIVTDSQYKNTFLKLSRSLVPSGKNHDRIDLRSGHSEVSVTAENRAAISKKISASRVAVAKPADSSLQEEQISGTLRAVNLDEDWLIVHQGGEQIRIDNLGDTADDVIGPMVNKNVVVRVLSNSFRKVFIDIERVE